MGLTLGFPYSSAIGGSDLALRELRIQSHGHAMRVFYAFDPHRDAVVLIGGDKTGVSGDRFYREYIPRAERLLREYLDEIEEEGDG
ncbi:MAG TPA: type II toxin-antitoxin system RelE/ParE family toxin [Thermoanaerobaculia bacterium]|nr:type II toxin-antitoxin system RelE/ParE family toxin [Thermoanaerobaculia bacterium]